MSPDETPGPPCPEEAGDPTLVAAAARSGIDDAPPPKRHNQSETPITLNDTEASR